MIETFIPFLLLAHVPVDVYDIYYGSQFVFNISNTMEYNDGNSTQHVNIAAKLKCQNLGIDSLTCTVDKASKQWYQENNIGNIASLDNPRFIEFPLFNIAPFEISFNGGNISRILVNKHNTSSLQKTIIIQLAELFNVHWVDINQPAKGLSTIEESTFNGKSHSMTGGCQSLVKMTKQKVGINNKIYPWLIESTGKKLTITSGMKLNFRKTVLSRNSCFKTLYLFYDKYNNVQLRKLDATHIKSQSYHSRVIISENEFVSISESLVNYCPKSIGTQGDCYNHNIYKKISITLNSIEQSTAEPSPIDSLTSINLVGNLFQE